MNLLRIKGTFTNKSWRHLAISAWSDILGPTNAVRIGELSGHSTDEVKTYIHNSDEANHAESIGLLGPLKIGSTWAKTGNKLMKLDRDRIASDDLQRLQDEYHPTRALHDLPPPVQRFSRSSNRTVPSHYHSRSSLVKREQNNVYTHSNVDISQSGFRGSMLNSVKHPAMLVPIHSTVDISQSGYRGSMVNSVEHSPMALATSYNDLIKTNMMLLQQSMNFGAGASNLHSVQHTVAFKKSEDIQGNINSGIRSQIKLEPHRRQNLPFLQHGVAIKKSPHIKGNMKFGSCSKLKFQTKHQIQKKPFTQKRKLFGDVSNKDTNKVFKKKKFKRASDLGLFL